MYMKEGESVPGKKGIALKPEQYGKIKVWPNFVKFN